MISDFILTRPYIRFLKAHDERHARMAGGDLEERVPNIRKDELGQLAAHINEMAAELQLQRKKEREDEVSRMELCKSAASANFYQKAIAATNVRVSTACY